MPRSPNLLENARLAMRWPHGLVKKLGLKAWEKMLLSRAPETFAATLVDLPTGSNRATRSGGRARRLRRLVDLRATRRTIEKLAPPVDRAIRPTEYLWFAYPKKSGCLPQ